MASVKSSVNGNIRNILTQVQSLQVARNLALDRLSLLTSAAAEFLLHLDEANVIG
jgi:hypothetical protein